MALSDLLSVKTLVQWKDTLVNNATSVGLPTSNWSEGGYTRTLVALFAQLYQTAGDVVRVIAAGGFLDFAEGAWLTLLAKQVFNVDRIEATFASAPNAITLTNGGGGLFVFDAGDIVFAHSSTQKTYRNTSGGTLAPGGTLTLDIAAEEAGSGSSANVGTITVVVTTFQGVTCTNTLALVGLDAEKDPALRQRCRDSLASLAVGGIKRVYHFVAKSAKRPDGTAIGVTRVRPMPPPGDGTLTVFVAGASGAITSPDVDTIQAAFDALATPYGFNATAQSASNLTVSVPCTIWVPASLGLSEGDAQKAVFDKLKAYVEALDIGGVIISPATGKIYWRLLVGIIAGAIPGMLKVQLASEVDIGVADGEAPVWSGVLSETTVMQVAA